MTKRTKNIVLASVLLVAPGVLLVLAVAVRGQPFAPLSYNETSYDIEVLDNGNTRVTMTLDYRLGRRDSSKSWKQLHRTIPLSASGVTNVAVEQVRNLSTGETYRQGDPVDASLYDDGGWDIRHARQWYIATQGDMLRPCDPHTNGIRAGSSQSIVKNVEIGWNIPPTKTAKSMRFEVTMTLAGMVTACPGNDVFNWQPVDETNESPIRRFSATVRFPQAADEANSTMWVHYDGTSTTAYRDGMFTFGIDDVRAIIRPADGDAAGGQRGTAGVDGHGERTAAQRRGMATRGAMAVRAAVVGARTARRQRPAAAHRRRHRRDRHASRARTASAARTARGDHAVLARPAADQSGRGGARLRHRQRRDRRQAARRPPAGRDDAVARDEGIRAHVSGAGGAVPRHRPAQDRRDDARADGLGARRRRRRYDEHDRAAAARLRHGVVPTAAVHVGTRGALHAARDRPAARIGRLRHAAVRAVSRRRRRRARAVALVPRTLHRRDGRARRVPEAGDGCAGLPSSPTPARSSRR